MILAEEQQSDLFQQLLALLQALIMPVWADLIALIPILLVGVVALFLLFMAWQWWRARARNAPRLIPRYGGTPPPGIHMPGPSWWPLLAPIALAIIFYGVIFNPVLIVFGVVIGLLPLVGWLRDANREWRRTALAGEGAAELHAPTVAPALAAGVSTATAPVPARMALVPVAEGSVVETVTTEPPPGVHMPGPSPWPFFAPIALMVIFYGVIFSPILIVGGVVLGLIAAGGWLRDAGREYRSTEAVGHAIPATRDPREAWPRRLLPVFAVVIAACLVLVALPSIGGFLASFKPAGASPTPVSVPAKPEISASSAISFETKTLIVPAGRPFELVFHNKNAGVPHNVRIDTPDKQTTLFDGEPITGVADVTYQVPALPAGNYYFLCKIHPNMNGTVQAVPESGAAGGSPAAASATP